jgi:manganese/iron transport system permease protein
VPSPFELEFFREGVAEILLLAVACGLAGTWIVLRGLAFFAHAAGTATFPGLVVADGLGFAAVIGAFGGVLVAALLLTWLVRGRGTTTDSATALVLAGSLAAGAILASDVFQSGANVDRLLFGSLLAIDGGDLALAAVAAAAVLAGGVLLGPRWLAHGFSGEQQRRPPWSDAVLVLLVALCAVAALAAVGALLATALLVTPAATTRLFTDRLRTWQVATVVLAAVEGVGGLWLAYELNAPPGAGIAVLAGAAFALAVLCRAALRGDAAARRRAARLARVGAAGAGLVTVLAFAGCGGTEDAGGAPGDGRLAVVATTAVAGDLARQAGGDAVAVRTLIGAGADPHTYEPRPQDVAALADADVIVLSGLGLDDWARQLIESSGSRARIVDLGAGAPHRRAGEEGEEGDPHWWHDPRNAQAATRTLGRAFAAERPAERTAIAAATARQVARLAALDRRIAACLRRIPVAERKLVTNHDALGHFTGRYGLRVVGAAIPSQSTAGQASAGELARLERAIEREHVRAVFPEESVSSKLARQIARVTGASASLELYGDALGAPGSGAETVDQMLRTNADRVARGLSGERVRCEGTR